MEFRNKPEAGTAIECSRLGIAVPAVKTLAIISALLICFVLFVPHRPLAHGLDEATALNQQVIQLYNQARFSEALPLAQPALAIREKALRPDHPDVANAG